MREDVVFGKRNRLQYQSSLTLSIMRKEFLDLDRAQLTRMALAVKKKIKRFIHCTYCVSVRML